MGTTVADYPDNILGISSFARFRVVCALDNVPDEFYTTAENHPKMFTSSDVYRSNVEGFVLFKLESSLESCMV